MPIGNRLELGWIALSLLTLSSVCNAQTTSGQPAESPLGTATQSSSPAVGVNVVLIEISSVEGKSTGAVDTDCWDHWEKMAPMLLNRIQRGGMWVRDANLNSSQAASLYTLRCAASGLTDTNNLALLAEQLDSICDATQRPSLLVVWLPGEETIMLGVQDATDLRATMALSPLHEAQ